MKYKIAIGIGFLIMLLAISSACVVVVTNVPPTYYGTGNVTGVPTYYQTVAPNTQLQILNNKLTHDASGKAIGLVTIKNVGSNTADSATVTAKFFDANNNLVYTTQDSVLSLGPGESWDFTFTCNVANCNKVTKFTVDLTYG